VRHGFFYASARLETPLTVRPSAVLLVSTCGQAFQLRTPHQVHQAQLALVQPMVARSLQARGCQLLSLNIHPTHPDYLRLRGLPEGGVQVLPAALLADLQPALRALCLTAPQAVPAGQPQALAQQLLLRLQPWLPPETPADPLRPALLAWLRQHPEAPLGDMAQAMGVSYHHMSHRFAQAMGLPFRHWCAFARTLRAGRQFGADRSLTGIAHEAGYTDSAHLSRTWHRVYGLSPSQVRQHNSVQASRP
jgi:AraC-like DNA-binding protein